MPHDAKRFLLPEVISKLKSFELKAKLIVEGFITGMHKSPYHGFSVEFAEHRQYTVGDEIRHLDWKVLGRTGKYYVKQYEEETNLRSFIILDTSSSMKYRSNEAGLSKIDYAALLSSALISMMISQRDAVGLVTFNSSLKDYIPPSLKSSHQHLLFSTLERISTGVISGEGDSTNLAQSLSTLSERVKKRSLIIVISDFWDDPEKAVAALKHYHHRHHEVLVFHIVDHKERTFDFDRPTEIIDLETGAKISTNPRILQHAYAARFIEHSQRIANPLMDNGIEYTLIDTSTPFDVALLAYLKKRSLIR